MRAARWIKPVWSPSGWQPSRRGRIAPSRSMIGVDRCEQGCEAEGAEVAWQKIKHGSIAKILTWRKSPPTQVTAGWALLARALRLAVCAVRSGVSALALGELAAVPAAGAPKREDPCWGAARRGTLVSAERDGSTFGEVAHRGPTWRNPSGLLRGGQLTAGGGSDRPARQLLLGGVMA